MALTDVDICNSALDELGLEPIKSLDEGSKRAKLCKRNYSIIRRKMLRAHPWNFARKRTTLEAESNVFAPADVNTTTDQVTITSHGKKTGQKVLMKPEPDDGTTVIPGGLLASQTYFLVVVDANTIQFSSSYDDSLDGITIDLVTAPNLGDTKIFYSPVYNFEFQTDLPKDYLFLRDIEDYNAITFKIEGDKIVSSSERLRILYIGDVKEELFDANFVEALSLSLAAKMAYSLVQSNELQGRLRVEAEEFLARARSLNAQQGTPDSIDANEWINVRGGGLGASHIGSY